MEIFFKAANFSLYFFYKLYKFSSHYIVNKEIFIYAFYYSDMKFEITTKEHWDFDLVFENGAGRVFKRFPLQMK